MTDRRRKHSTALEEDTSAHLWAISYADLLMVLLSFFVIYFNPDEDVKKPVLPPPHVATVIDRVLPQLSHLFFGSEPSHKEVEATSSAKPSLTETKASSVPSAPQSPSEPSQYLEHSGQASLGAAGHPRDKSSNEGLATLTTEDAEAAKPLPTKLQEAIAKKSLDVVFEAAQDELVVHFDADAYRPGKFDVSVELATSLERLLSAVAPFRGQVVLTFIGHADSQPLSLRLKKRILSNMVLSSMRAAVAADYATQSGFDQKFVLTQGTGSYGRNSRTLTVRISERPTL